MSNTSPLSAPILIRAQALQNLANKEFDVVIVGGGVTGLGVAVDAASRGLHVALLERHDFS